MTLQKLILYKTAFQKLELTFFTDIFSKAIWGDMGEDCASVTITASETLWHVHFIRTQTGEPLPLSETVCNVIDEYEKELDDEELFEFLAHHNITKEFEDSIQIS